ncbi:hypothetical protein [Streptomyces vietnamensis]|uniref:hypothetical protein n=1 Tax=Streptomyces vietnamensis TaxID=362257 RepID=UPI00341994F2
MTPHRPDAEHVDILADGETIAAVGDVIEAPDAGVVDFSGRVVIGQPALERLSRPPGAPSRGGLPGSGRVAGRAARRMPRSGRSSTSPDLIDSIARLVAE